MIIEEVTGGEDVVGTLTLTGETHSAANTLLFTSGSYVLSFSVIGEAIVDGPSQLTQQDYTLVFANFDGGGDSIKTDYIIANTDFRTELLQNGGGPLSTPYEPTLHMETGLVTQAFNSSETNLGNLTLSSPLITKGSSLDGEQNQGRFFVFGNQQNGGAAFGYYVTYKLITSGTTLNTTVTDNSHRLSFLTIV